MAYILYYNIRNKQTPNTKKPTWTESKGKK